MMLHKSISCDMQNFAGVLFSDMEFFVVCGNKCLRLEMTEISSGN